MMPITPGHFGKPSPSRAAKRAEGGSLGLTPGVSSSFVKTNGGFNKTNKRASANQIKENSPAIAEAKPSMDHSDLQSISQSMNSDSFGGGSSSQISMVDFNVQGTGLD
jgi:hypothetical protein